MSTTVNEIMILYRADFSGLASVSARATQSINSVSQAAQHASSSFTGGLNKAVGGGISSMLSLASNANIAVGGLFSLARGAVDAGQSLLAPAMSAEENRIAFKGLLGSMDAANDMMRRLGDFAEKTPFEFSELTTSTQRFLQMKWSVNQSMDAMQTLGDAVSHFGKKAPELDRITWALQQISNNGKVTSEDMSQIADAGLPAWELLAQGMGTTIAQAKQMVTDGLVPADKGIQAILQSSKQYKGSMDDMSKSTSGMLSSLSDVWNKALQGFGENLLTPLKGAIGQLTTWLKDPAINAAATSIGTNLAGAFTIMGNAIMTYVVPGLQHFSTLAGQVMNIVNDEGLGILVGSFQNLGDTISRVLQPALQPLVDGFTSLFSDQNILGGAQATSASFYDIAHAVDQVSLFVSTLPAKWNDLMVALAPVGAFLVSTFKPAWDQLSSTFSSELVPAWNNLMAAIGPLMPQLQLLGGIIGGAILINLGLLVSAIGAVAAGFAKGIPHVLNALSGLVTYFTGAFEFIGNLVMFFVNLLTGQFDKLGGNLSGMGAGIVKMFTGTWQIVSGLFMGALSFITGTVGTLVHNVRNFFQGLYNTLVGHSIIPDMVNGIVNWFQQLPGRAGAAVQDMIGRVTGFFNDLASKGASFGQGLIQGFIDGVNGMVNAAGEAVGNVMDYVASFLPHSPAERGPLSKLDEFGPGMVDTFASGIIESTPMVEHAVKHLIQPASTQLSNVPLTQYTSGSNSRSGGSTTIVINLDGRELARALGPIMSNEIRLDLGVIA